MLMSVRGALKHSSQVIILESKRKLRKDMMSITLEASRQNITFVFIQIPQERESIDHTLRNEVAIWYV